MTMTPYIETVLALDPLHFPSPFDGLADVVRNFHLSNEGSTWRTDSSPGSWLPGYWRQDDQQPGLVSDSTGLYGIWDLWKFSAVWWHRNVAGPQGESPVHWSNGDNLRIEQVGADETRWQLSLAASYLTTDLTITVDSGTGSLAPASDPEWELLAVVHGSAVTSLWRVGTDGVAVLAGQDTQTSGTSVKWGDVADWRISGVDVGTGFAFPRRQDVIAPIMFGETLTADDLEAIWAARGPAATADQGAGWSVVVGGRPFDVVDVSVDRNVRSPLPGQVSDPAGTTVSGGSVTVVTGDSPWTSDALHGADVVLRWDGERVFTGSVLDTSGSAGSGVVALTVADVGAVGAGGEFEVDVPVLPDVAPGAGGAELPVGMHSQWVASDLLSRVGLGPHAEVAADPSTVLHMPLAGSLWPTVSSPAVPPLSDATVTVEPDWVRAPWGMAAAGGAVDDVAVDEILLDVGTTIRTIVATVRPASGGAVGEVNFEWGIRDIVWPSGSGEPGPGYFTVDWTVTPSGNWKGTSYWRGVLLETWALSPIYPGPAPGSTVSRWSLSGSGPFGGLTGQINPEGLPPVEPSGDLGTFGSPLQLSTVDDEHQQIWPAIQDIAAASGSTAWVDAYGVVQARGPDDWSMEQPTATLDGVVLSALDWDTTVETCRQWILVPYTPIIKHPTNELAGSMVYVQERAKVSVEIGWDAVAYIDTTVQTADLYDAESGGSYIDVIGEVKWSAVQTTARTAVVTVTNPNQYLSGWAEIVPRTNPNHLQVWTVQNEQQLLWETESNCGKTWKMPRSQFLQSIAAARDIAIKIAPDLSDPPPEVSGLSVADPSLRLSVGDVVALDEPVFTGVWWRRAAVVSVAWDSTGVQTVKLRGIRDVWQNVEAIWAGYTWQDFEDGWAGKTWADFQAAPYSITP